MLQIKNNLKIKAKKFFNIIASIDHNEILEKLHELEYKKNKEKLAFMQKL